MNSTNGNGKINLDGPGAAYLRVSDDQQDTLRQYEALHAFEKRHSVTIPKQNWFKDEGWARDTADRRPDFLRLMKLAETGRIKWIVVSERDRFGTTDADEFIHFRYLLRKWGCRLYDATGTDWTHKDIATIITAVVDGEKSEQEQHSISKRVLGSKAALAREGEWQGGLPRLGFDVVSYSRATGDELWRVVGEGLHKRRKVYPDGREERFDGKGNFPKYQDTTEVLRLGPCNDKAKIDAAVSVFKRFATESISENLLAHYLNKLGFLTAQGNPFIGHHVKAMLEDPIYIGYYAWNRRHFGKFHRWTEGQAVLELNYNEQQSRNDKADWVQSRRLFEPLVDRPTWEAVQKKLDKPSRATAPRSAALYLGGLVVCGNCGSRMIAGRGRSSKTDSQPLRFEFICGGYHRAVRYKKREGCTCLRNSVFQHELEGYVNRYLEETGKRLELLTAGTDTSAAPGYLLAAVQDHTQPSAPGPRASHLTDGAEQDLHSQHNKFIDNVTVLLDYIRDNDPKGWEEMWSTVGEAQDVPYERAIEFYRRCFSAESLDAQLADLDAQHTALMHRYADLPTPLAKEKAKKELAALEDRIGELQRQQQDISNIVERQWQEIRDLARTICEAEEGMKCDNDPQALRRRAEALRGIIHRIECTFTVTGATGGGHHRKNTQLAKVTIYPVVGDARHFLPDDANSLLRPMRATSHM